MQGSDEDDLSGLLNLITAVKGRNNAILSYIARQDELQTGEVTRAMVSYVIPVHGGSRPGMKSANRARDYDEHYRTIAKFYFKDMAEFDDLFGCELNRDPIYSKSLFRRRFRMSRDLFWRIFKAIEAADLFFTRRPDACGKLGQYGLVKAMVALRKLSYGCSSDSLDETFGVSETQVDKCVTHFCKAILQCFAPIYLRKPTEEDIRRLYYQAEERGVPGYIGSLDCMHLFWKNCPVGLAGQYKGKEKSPTIVLEAVCAHDLWIWHFNFGSAGSNNDISILEASTLLDDIKIGRAHKVPYMLSNHVRTLGFFFSDGIYPEYCNLAKTLSAPRDKKEKYYKTVQEAIRKDVERLFGVLKAKWHILQNELRSWYSESISLIVHTVLCLHNMIVEERRRQMDEGGCDDEDFAAILADHPYTGGERVTPFHRIILNDEALPLPDTAVPFAVPGHQPELFHIPAMSTNDRNLRHIHLLNKPAIRCCFMATASTCGTLALSASSHALIAPFSSLCIKSSASLPSSTFLF